MNRSKSHIALGFNPTETHTYFHDANKIVVRIEDSDEQYAWQLEVNGKLSRVSTYYPGIVECAGYAIATEYWSGTFPPMIPFRIIPVTTKV